MSRRIDTNPCATCRNKFLFVLVALLTLNVAAYGQTASRDNGEKVTWPSVICRFNKCEVIEAFGYLYAKPEQTRVVVISHGAGGIDARVFDRADALQAEGFAALVIDHFGSRGIGETINDLKSSNERGGNDFNLTTDVYTAIDMLERRGFTKFGSIGGSLGGGAQIYMQQDWARRSVNSLMKSHLKRTDYKMRDLDASVALYAGCGYRNSVRDKFSNTPLLFINGEIDNITPAKYCERQVPWMNERGGNTSFVTLPNQGHGFDDRKYYARNPGVIHMANCELVIDAEGVTNLKDGERTLGTELTVVVAKALKSCGTTRGFDFGRRGDRKIADPIWLGFFKQHL